MPKLEKQSTLKKIAKDRILVYADTREQSSRVTQLLKEMGCEIEVKQLEVGDFLLSDSVVVERKTIADFVSSIVDGRLFNQLSSMTENFEKPLVLVEGHIYDLFETSNMHKNALIGALTSIALDCRVPVLFTAGQRETAEFLYVIAKREQLGKTKQIRLRIGRKGLTLQGQRQFIVESLPLVGAEMAKKLLKRFGSVKAIVNASEKELQEVENLGKKKAEGIRKALDSKFKERD